MIQGAFGAGFAEGFGTKLAEDITSRRKRRDKYVDNIIDNAKSLAPAYAQSEAEISNMEDMMSQMGEDFGITSDEFIGLAQNYDINEIYKNVYTAKGVLEKNNISGSIDKSMILGSLKLPENFKLPKDVSPEKALRMIFQGAAANLARDPNNKSESHQAGSFGKAVADVLALNPRATAEDITSGMQVAGINVDKILAYKASGGVKQEPFDIDAAGPFAKVNIEYDAKQGKTTANAYRGMFSKKFAGTEDFELLTTNEDIFAAAQANFGSDKSADAIYDEVFEAGNTMASLERQLIGKGLNSGMGVFNIREAAMRGVVGRLESVTEMQKLVSSIEAGEPVAQRIIEKFDENQMITDKDMDYILYGEEMKPENGSSKKPIKKDDVKLESGPTAPRIPTPEEQMTEAMNVPDLAQLPAGEQMLPTAPTEVRQQAPTDIGMGDTVMPEDIISEDTRFTAAAKQIADTKGIDMNATGPSNRADQLEVFEEAFKTTMSEITYDEWKEIKNSTNGRQRLKDRGLPESYFQLAMYGGGSRNFKGGKPWYERTKTEPQSQEESIVELTTDLGAVITEDIIGKGISFKNGIEAKNYVEGFLREKFPQLDPAEYDTDVLINSAFTIFAQTNIATEPEQPRAAEDPSVDSVVDDILSK